MKVVLNKDGTGKVIYNSEIIRDIVECVLMEVEGVVPFSAGNKQSKKHIKVDFLKDGVCIDVSIKLKINANVSQVAGEIQSLVKKNIESMTEFKLSQTNVHVIDVDFSEN